jgi:hypothetical protein
VDIEKDSGFYDGNNDAEDGDDDIFVVGRKEFKFKKSEMKLQG